MFFRRGKPKKRPSSAICDQRQLQRVRVAWSLCSSFTVPVSPFASQEFSLDRTSRL